MPLNLLVPSMQRVSVASSSQPDPPSPHPLHELLDQVLLSVRTAANKYHVELPQILADGGGQGEAEEMMMWYALNHEKADGEDAARGGEEEGPWLNAAWRKRWLDRLERREVRIQILLYFLKLALPGPQPPDAVEEEAPPARRHKRGKPKPKIAVLSVQERLESLMDKMATWQMLDSFGDDPTGRKQNVNLKDERDWTQKFCEDVVEPLFKKELPQLCELFRTKVFPDSPFSDDNSSDTERRSSSPAMIEDSAESVVIPSLKRERSASILSNHSRYPSPALSTASTSHKNGKEASLARSRSRSLSVSLAQDANSRRAGSVGLAKKPALNREVSMSRVFKEKPAKKEADAKKARTLSSAAPSAAKPAKASVDSGVTLVASTPVKKVKTQQLLSFGMPIVPRVTKSPTPGGMGEEEEEDWSVFSSPDVLLLGVGDEIKNESRSIGQVLAQDTPVKGGRTARHKP
ncbi:hypothetical protein HWV62_10635 [Athelia sp. TMB]|nr:hypothetical protein HWV62_10635 [Athelia sp. TMB]